MENATKISLSKTLKLPIEGIAFSNKQIGVTIEYDANVDLDKAIDEINQILTILKEDDPQWIAQKKVDFKKEENQTNFLTNTDTPPK